MKLDKAFAKKVEPLIDMLWQTIGGDVEAMGPCDNETAIEMCIDADRPVMYGRDYPEEVAALTEALKEHTYMKILNCLDKHINLC